MSPPPPTVVAAPRTNGPLAAFGGGPACSFVRSSVFVLKASAEDEKSFSAPGLGFQAARQGDERRQAAHVADDRVLGEVIDGQHARGRRRRRAGRYSTCTFQEAEQRHELGVVVGLFPAALDGRRHQEHGVAALFHERL